MKKNLIVFSIATFVTLLSFETKSPKSYDVPPSGYSGAPTQSRTCRNCHSSYALNTAGGSIAAIGLPTTYVPGQAYNFKIVITNAVSRGVWGFEIKAVDMSNAAVGTFSSTNPNTTVGSGELKHNLAVASTGTTYTYDNLKWTAPTGTMSPVSFYFTGVAGDNDGSEFSDYVYSNTLLNVTLPVTLAEFTAVTRNNAVFLRWNTYTEINSKQFEIERSIDGDNFENIKTVASVANSSTVRQYDYVDQNLPKQPQLYYRLKQVDIDGKYWYSKILLVRLSDKGFSIDNVYPKPASRVTHVAIYSDKITKAALSIIDMNGKVVIQESVSLNKGNNLVDVNCMRLAKGAYVLKLQNETGESVIDKLIKQ